ncbi:hypothetical protein VTN31DRAFT_203 [Thermomyces dupontii]|uniref:uncharacterized protein n=1 Tax=Talaromyces thermophilus TaxID=28565 RepID=UPI003742185C
MEEKLQPRDPNTTRQPSYAQRPPPIINEGEDYYPPPPYSEIPTEGSSHHTTPSEKQSIPTESSELEVDRSSICTSGTGSTKYPDITTFLSLSPSSAPVPCRRLRIDALGLGFVRKPQFLPVIDTQLEVPIVDVDTDQPVYVSKRHKRRFGDAVLVDQSGKTLIKSRYFFGPGKDPVLKILSGKEEQDENEDQDSLPTIKVETHWTTRATDFIVPALDGRPEKHFEWRYAKRKDPQTGKQANLLVLRRKSPNGGSGSDSNSDSDGKILAELVRSRETRTPGTSKGDAGNGGLLLIDQDSIKEIDQSVVVATCLVMLKREVDRRRGIHAMMWSGMMSGGG